MAQTDDIKVKVTADVSSSVKGLKALNKEIRELIQNFKQLEIESRRARQEIERLKKEDSAETKYPTGDDVETFTTTSVGTETY